PDFRAAERTFQLITQVAGRAGRGDVPGTVVIQTFSPDHYAIHAAAAHDMNGFYEEETRFRKELGYPPFARLISIKIKGNSEAGTAKAAEKLGRISDEELREWKGITVLGPSQAPIYKIRGKYRWHMLVKGKDSGKLHSFVRNLLLKAGGRPGLKGAELQVDVDPLNMV
ncbi:MAG: primosomal protein N', partial [Deltaproteobacteria bacterium]